MSSSELEEGTELKLDYRKIAAVAAGEEDVLPAVAQDVDSGEVLVIGYVNKKALQYALEQRLATFWSTSRGELWVKGATSGDYLDLMEVRVNCEQNSLLYIVRLRGKGACHTKDGSGESRKSCYYRRIDPDGSLEFVDE